MQGSGFKVRSREYSVYGLGCISFGERIWSGVYTVCGVGCGVVHAWSSAARRVCRFRVESTAYVVWGVCGVGRVYGVGCIWWGE